MYSTDISYGLYSSLWQSRKALTTAIKLSIKGKLVYQICSSCSEYVWFPNIKCMCGIYYQKIG